DRVPVLEPSRARLTMRIAVDFADQRVEFDSAEGSLRGVWQGPPGLNAEAARLRALEALERPLAYPALRQAVVPGDQVVIPIGSQVPAIGTVLEAVFEVLQGAGVAGEAITVLTRGNLDDLVRQVPFDVKLVAHDSEDASKLAYLASTAK